MTLYSIALFVHLLGFIAFFAGIAMQQRAGFNLRGATDVVQARFWLQLLAATTSMIPAGSAMLLVSGIVMTAISWSGGPAWVGVSAIGLIVMAAIYVLIVMRRFRAMRAAVGAVGAAGEEGTSLSPMTQAAGSVWTWLWLVNGGALAIMWLMVDKPGIAGSIGTLAGGMLLGAVIGSVLSRPRPRRDPGLAGL